MGSKNIKKEISVCHFKIRILEKDEDTNRFTPELNGYLNRLGKRHLCSYSHNIAKDLPSLATFIPLDTTPKHHFAYKPYVKPGSNTLDPLSTINNEGRKILEKLRHFVTRQEIYNFIVEQEVSGEALTELRKMAVGGK